MSYKDDLDAIAGGLKDTNKLTLNAITELDNAGKLGMYGGEGGGDDPYPIFDVVFEHTEDEPIYSDRNIGMFYPVIIHKAPSEFPASGDQVSLVALELIPSENILYDGYVNTCYGGMREGLGMQISHLPESDLAVLAYYYDVSLLPPELAEVIEPNTWYYVAPSTT